MRLAKKQNNFIFTFIFLFINLTISISKAETGITKKANPDNLKIYVNQIIGQGNVYRNYQNISELNRVSGWIKEQMQLFGIPCSYQNFQVNQMGYRNVVCTLNLRRSDKVIVGAHYDVYGDQAGADDNASGVAGVLETARLLAQNKNSLSNNIEFVFYTLEEPPYFKTEHMGSYVHAKSVQGQKENILGIFVLEMIGYFDSKNIQTYPTGLKWLYPSHGDFIAAISNFDSRSLGADYCESMSKLGQLDCQRLVGPSFVEGVDFSDHANYWKFDIPAVMITDTAFFRNKNYHTTGDVAKTLNYTKMSYVINGLVKHLIALK